MTVKILIMSVLLKWVCSGWVTLCSFAALRRENIVYGEIPLAIVYKTFVRILAPIVSLLF